MQQLQRTSCIEENILLPYRDEGSLRGTTLLARRLLAALDRANGRFPPPATPPDRCARRLTGRAYRTGSAAGEFNPGQHCTTAGLRSRGALLGSHLSLPARCWTAYYSRSGLLIRSGSLFAPTSWEARQTAAIRLCGPREIRTLDLLNAIETRSQLRYGPKDFFQQWNCTRSFAFRQ